jgi:hypothetical protein
MKDFFSHEALQAYEALVVEQHSFNFSEKEVYDFTRCVRQDGSAYGTGGKCRKGTEQVKEINPNIKGKAKEPEKKVTPGRMRLTARVKSLPVKELKKILVDPRLNDKQREQVNKLLAKRKPSSASATKVSALPQQKASVTGKGERVGTEPRTEPEVVKATKKEVLDDIRSILEEHRSPRETTKKVNSAGLSWEEEIAAIMDSKIEKSNHVRQGDPKYDGWSRTLGGGARVLGSGMYGTAILSPDGEVIKRGIISRTEAAIVDKVGRANLGPKLIAADIGGPAGRNGTGIDLRNGRIAMTKVEGDTLGVLTNYGRVRTDAYWKARADLHRMGIAHNDMHGGNVLVDEKGKGRFVDMGLAQDNPKAALVEALGAFPGPKGKSADHTFSSWGPGGNLIADVERKNIPSEQRAHYLEFLKEDAPLAYKAYTNKERAIEKLRRFGIEGENLDKVLKTRFRTPDKKYKEGVWAKLSDTQAMEVINTLYEGI